MNKFVLHITPTVYILALLLFLSSLTIAQQAGKIIYVHEPSPKQEKKTYCIIDLLSKKAEAKNVQILLD